MTRNETVEITKLKDSLERSVISKNAYLTDGEKNESSKQITHVKNERGIIMLDSTDIKHNTYILNNFMPLNL